MTYNFTDLAGITEISDFLGDSKILINTDNTTKQILPDLVKADIDNFIRYDQKGQANGVATLNEHLKIPVEQLPINKNIFFILEGEEHSGAGTLVSDGIEELNPIFDKYIESGQITLQLLNALSKLKFSCNEDISNISVVSGDLKITLQYGYCAYYNKYNGWSLAYYD